MLCPACLSLVCSCPVQVMLVSKLIVLHVCVFMLLYMFVLHVYALGWCMSVLHVCALCCYMFVLHVCVLCCWMCFYCRCICTSLIYCFVHFPKMFNVHCFIVLLSADFIVCLLLSVNSFLRLCCFLIFVYMHFISVILGCLLLLNLAGDNRWKLAS